MSASSKKKLRKEQQSASMTKKQQAAKKEATKLKIYTWSFWIVIALCVSIVAGIALKAPVTTMMQRMTTAVTVGDHKVSATELNYFYIDAINQYCNEYSSYLQYLLDTKSPLSQQTIDKDSGKTWADNFIEMAVNQAKNTYALYDAAKAAGYTLPKDEADAMTKLYDSMDDYAKQKGFSNPTKYLQSIYGNGASEKTYKAYYEVTTLASSYYNHYAKTLKDGYTDSDLRAFEASKLYEYNSYTYASFYMSVDKFKTGGTKDDKGNITYTAEEIKAAEKALKEAAEKLGIADNNTLEKLNAAIAEWEKSLTAKDENKKEENKTETTAPETTVPETTVPETTVPDSTEAEPTEPASEPSEPAEPDAQVEDSETTEGTVESTEAPTDPSEESTEAPTDPSQESTDASEPADEKDDEDDDKDDDKDEDNKKYSTATENKDVLYSKISSVMQEWLRDAARKNGDIKAIPYETTSTDKDGKEVKTLKGYYIVLFQSINDNKYPLANVRHILVGFEGGTKDSSGNVSYSTAEKAAAKKQAEALLDQWKKGDANEDSFAALANKESDDGDGTTGGLYENVYPGQMVTNFNDWCFDESRKAGDTGIVESTYGYHVMFYVGDSEQIYRDYMITNDKLSKDMEAWQTSLNDAITVDTKNTKYINRDLIIDSSSVYT